MQGNFDTLNGQYGDLKGRLDMLTGHSIKLEGALQNLADTAHLPRNLSLDDLVQGIASKLPKGGVTIKGNNNVTSIGSNGQTAHTIVNNAKPPEWRAVENKNAVMTSGGYIFESIIEVVADSVPNNILFSAYGASVKGIEVQPLSMGIVNFRTGSQDGRFNYLISQPIGRFRVTVRAVNANTSPNLDINFNVNVAD